MFARFGRPPVPLVPLVLDHNLRNTRQIAERLRPPRPDADDACAGGDGPEVAFVPCASEAAIDVADDQVDALLDEGWRPEDIALLTTGSRHPEQVERQEQTGRPATGGPSGMSDDVFYGHVLGFKGLERRAVVLASNETKPTARARSSTSACRAPRTSSSSSATPSSSGRSAATRSPNSSASDRASRGGRA